ncbi:MAG: SDR family NAD(P)-dependent oxidoreductase [Sphaerochaetaceae bacterium]|nr:SDR family NAD(P)-dependent oxidoreductase [Sphaerochaetaceae bacterium]
MDTIVISGATSGIGLETARLLLEGGFSIIGIGSNDDSCKKAMDHVANSNAVFLAANLMQQREVSRVSDLIIQMLNKTGRRLKALINNAGGVRSWYSTTEEGYEQQFALNHLAGFLLTYRLFPYLIDAQGRIIMTSSGSHLHGRVHWNDIMMQRRYSPLKAYSQSKLCNLLFADELNRRFARTGIRAYAVDPQLVRTDIGSKHTGVLVKTVWSIRKRSGVDPVVPAQTYLFLCTANPAPPHLYYRQQHERPFSRYVRQEEASRLFSLSEQLCGISFEAFR